MPLHHVSAALEKALRVTALVIAMVASGLAAAADAVAAEIANGIFLVAKHEMQDPRFRQTVVLVTQPQQGSPFGVVVNRPLPQPLSQVFPGQAGLKGSKQVLYFGGPVAPQGLVFLVRTPAPPARAVHVLKDVYLTGDAEWIESQFKRPDPLRWLRVFTGYSGWGPGQLQNELKRGDWHVLPADPELIFEKEADELWPELIRRATLRPTRAGLKRTADLAAGRSRSNAATEGHGRHGS